MQLNNTNQADVVPCCVQVDGTIPAYWRDETYGIAEPSSSHLLSTGYYAAPGKQVTITLPTAVVNTGVNIHIGLWNDWLYEEKSWSRFPQVKTTYGVFASATSIASSFGGPIYTSVPVGSTYGLTSVTLSGGIVQMPRYMSGTTTAADWSALLAQPATASWAEIVSSSMIITLPSSLLWQIYLADPQAVLARSDQVTTLSPTNTSRARSAFAQMPY